MPFRKCEHHGWVWRRGGKHCPACGKKLLALPLWPFRIYIPAGTMGILLGAAAAVALVWFLATRTTTLESMPPEWHSLYNAIRAISDSPDRYTAFKGFMEESGDDMPPLTPDQMDKFVKLFKPRSPSWTNWSDKAFISLQPCILDAKPDQ